MACPSFSLLSTFPMEREEIRRYQLVGMITGILGGVMTANFFPDFRDSIGGWGPVVFWGAAVGGLLGSPTALQRIGLILTRDPKKEATNLVIGILVPIITILVLYWLYSSLL